MQKHAIFNNTTFTGLAIKDRDLLFRNAILYHFETHNNQQTYDIQGYSTGFEKKYVPFKEYASRVRVIISPILSIGELKSQNQEIQLSIPARNALKNKNLRYQLGQFCEKNFTDCFNDILAEKNAAATKAAEAATEAAVKAAVAATEATEEAEAVAKEKAALAAERQRVMDGIQAALAEWDE